MQGELYKTWAGIKNRCFNPNCKQFHRYGGRGITMCQRWLESFENFVQDVGLRPSPKHQLDRLDNDGNYDSLNCHWLHISENTRKANSLMILNPEIIDLVFKCIYIKDYSIKMTAQKVHVHPRTISQIINGQMGLRKILPLLISIIEKSRGKNESELNTNTQFLLEGIVTGRLAKIRKALQEIGKLDCSGHPEYISPKIPKWGKHNFQTRMKPAMEHFWKYLWK